MRLRSLAALHLTTCALLTAAVWGADPAGAGAAGDQSLLSATNAARADAGLPAYHAPPDLQAVAHRWAQWMAAHRVLAHNPSLPSSVCCWSDLGENVGVGSSARSVHRAFMASAPHRANILSATFTQVGVGTAVGGDGRLYVDEVFRRPRSQPSTTSVAPVRRPVPVRASRGVRRTAVAAVPRAAVPGAALLDRRVARTRLRLAAAAAHADPVRRAVLYVTAVRAVAG